MLYPPLPVTPRGRDAHDAELLARLKEHGRPVTLAKLFAGLTPRWAVDAVERLLEAGKVWEDEDGRLVVV